MIQLENTARRRAESPHPPEVTPRSAEKRILDAVAGIRYGSVVVSIQDGRVVQIDATEKQRIPADA